LIRAFRRRRGDGTYLTAKVHSSHGPLPVMVQLEGEAILRLLDVRRVLETGTVRRAAAMANLRQRSEISRLCDELLAIVDAGKPYGAADAAFHGAICDATGNPMFRQMLQRMDEAFERPADSPFNLPGFGLPDFRPVMAGWLIKETRSIQDGPTLRVGRRKDDP